MYEKLLKLWQEENEKENLVFIPKDFKTRVFTYVEELNKMMESYKEGATEKELIKNEILEFKLLFNDFLKVRLNKIICLTIEGVNLERTHLLSEEQKVIESFKSSMRNFFDSFQIRTETEETQLELTKEESKMVVIRILQDIDEEIVGIDLKNYGPFRKEDIATIPEKNAILLIEKNVAMPVKMMED